MLYVIGLGVFVLITMRIIQAGVADRPTARTIVTIVSIVIGLAFCAWLTLDSLAAGQGAKGGFGL